LVRRRLPLPPQPHLGGAAGGARSRGTPRARNGRSTALFAYECQSFLNNLIAGLGEIGAWNDLPATSTSFKIPGADRVIRRSYTAAMFGDITVKSRSLRLAFLIPPDKSALLKAIEVNSTLWGGFFNPIIPLFQQAPKAWKEYPGQKISMRNRVLGYVRAFDPDVLVNCTNGELPSYLNGGKRLSIRIDEIWSDFHSDERNGTPKYGVGIFELLNGIFKEFFEIKRRFPTKVLLPTYSDHELFWAATVGQLPDAHRTVIESNYSGAIDIEKPKLGPANHDSIVTSNSFFPRPQVHPSCSWRALATAAPTGRHRSLPFPLHSKL
jgi:hypothetical protein